MASTESIARAFHEAYEALAPQFSYKTREASAVPWENVPEDNKALMRATVARLIEDGVIPKSYPFQEGDVLVIGPECIADAGGAAINWKGEHYQRPVKKGDGSYTEISR